MFLLDDDAENDVYSTRKGGAPPPYVVRRMLSNPHMEKYFRNKSHKDREAEIEEGHQADWQKVAKFINKICFGIFLFIIVVMTCIVIAVFSE